MVEGGGGPGDWGRVAAAGVLGHVQRLVLVVKVTVGLVRHRTENIQNIKR